MDETVPRRSGGSNRSPWPGPVGHELLADLRAIASKNKIWRSFIGMGYSDTLVPR
jgi:glycine dehydrogenase